MSKYKVLTIAIAVKNNRVAKFGETVDDSELTTNAAELITAGALELLKSKEKAPTATEKGITEVETENETTAKVEEEEVEETVEDTKKAPTATERASSKK